MTRWIIEDLATLMSISLFVGMIAVYAALLAGA
jgi:hypothetical protein